MEVVLVSQVKMAAAQGAVAEAVKYAIEETRRHSAILDWCKKNLISHGGLVCSYDKFGFSLGPIMAVGLTSRENPWRWGLGDGDLPIDQIGKTLVSAGADYAFPHGKGNQSWTWLYVPDEVLLVG